MRRRLRGLVPLAMVLGLVAPAQAQAPDLYATGLQRIDALYMHRADVVPADLLVSAMSAAEREVEWLLVEMTQDESGATAVLRSGDGQLLGRVMVSDWDTLQRGLREAEIMLSMAGLPLPEETQLDVILLAGAADGLDRHSRVLHGEGLRAFDKRLKGVYFGIGARLRQRGDRVVVTEVFVDNPAYQAGLRTGDVIQRIDGVSTLGMSVDDAVNLITGPRGTQITVDVLRPDGDADVAHSFVVTRDEIQEPNVEWRSLENGFGYVRIDHFSELTTKNLDRALLELDDMGALERGLVIDLRDNTGGSMVQSANAADAFLEGGDLVRTVGADGKKVSGLVQHLWASDDGTEPQIPLVVLQNHRTASGSEILAGSLRELDRAVLIGTRTYGKGTVQKLYTLRSPGVRLKLTVAEYLLAGGLSINDDGGIPADLPVGEIRFDADGVRLKDDQAERVDPLLFVYEDSGWRDDDRPQARSEDPWLDLAVRVLALSSSPHRDDVLDAAGQVRELVRAEEEQRLVETFTARGIDWSPAPALGDVPTVHVELLTPEPAEAGKTVPLIARVTNLGDEPLHRVLVRVQGADRVWKERVLPVGYLEPGATSEGQALVTVYPGVAARESSVSVQVLADGRPAADAGPYVLAHRGGDQPPLTLSVALEPQGDAHQALITVRNDSETPLVGLRARFEVRPSSGIELRQYEAHIPALAAGAETQIPLALDISQVPDGQDLAVQVIVEEQRFGQLLEWPLTLPQDGTSVRLRAPVVEALDAPLSADAGAWTLRVKATDELALDHLVIWHNGEKIAWVPGNGRRLDVQQELDLNTGRNRILVETVDSQELSTWTILYVRGKPGDSVAEP